MVRMVDYQNHHATIFIPIDLASSIEAVRREWDPIMANQIAAHVTLVYPREARDVDLLVERLQTACAHIPPFRLRVGRLAYFGRPEDGVYIEVVDVDGGFDALREQVLRPPFERIAFPPHVTLIHPRTSSRGRTFWERASFHPPEIAFTPDEIAITAFDGTRWMTVEKVALRGEAQP
jgi:2'-5' RNA ligase